ncbi:hypothetical protein [Clostridium tertium]|uniref:Peptidase family M3 n=1 Tax=Clostridium tertium TaxID=1559 RepID=A0A6N3FN09_9CLOT
METLKNFKDLQYVRPNFDEINKTITSLTDGVKKAKNFEELKDIIKKFEVVYSDLHTNLAISMIRAYLDSSDKYYNDEMQEGMQNESTINYNEFYSELLNSSFTKEINNEFGEEFLIKLQDSINLKSKGMDLLEKEQELIYKYQKLKATIKVEFNGELLSEGEIRKYTTSKDRDVRKKATINLNKVYINLREDFKGILDELVKVRNEIAKVNGFKSFADYMNVEKGRRDYGQKELLDFCANVNEELSGFLEILSDAQAKRLGLDKLKYYDQGLNFLDGNAKPIGNGEVLSEKAKEMYLSLDRDISEIYNTMVDKNYLDVSESPNKISGMGFCTELFKLKFPYVFGNCDGSYTDVNVLTHEVGHAYQMYLSLKNQPLCFYSAMPNDVAEIPSKTMEHFAQDYSELFFGEDAKKFRFQFLEGSLKEVISYCAIHEFESWLYMNPEATIEERANKYLEETKKMNPGIDYSEIEGENIGEILLYKSMGVYMFPFYLISYAISAMSAMEFAKRMDKDKKPTWEDYKKLCSAGGSLSYYELLKAANLNSPFEKETIKNSIGFIKENLMKYID